MNRLIKKAILSRKQIQELSDFKQNITNLVLHDLKVPVNTILSLTKDENSEPMQNIHSQVQNINKLLENVLNVQRLEEPEIMLNKESIHVKDLLQDAINSVKKLAFDKNISIEISFYTTGYLSCDVGLILRSLVNILSNAIKFSSNSKHITVIVDRQDSLCRISIQDEGFGINPTHIPHIFDKFYSANKQESGKSYSTGLGLSLCKLAIEAHGGRISVESTVEIGSIFRCLLPNFTFEKAQFSDTVVYASELKFTNVEQALLCQFCETIKEISIYKVSELIFHLAKLESNNSKNIQIWIERFKQIVFSGDEISCLKTISAFANKTNQLIPV